MQVTTEQIDPCKIALTISVEPEEVDKARKRAFQQAVGGLQLPGFRKGKVPPHIAKGYISEDRVKQRAAESLIPDAYSAAVAETQVEPFAQPEMELVEMNDGGPLVFKAHVPLRPQVTLGIYKGLTLERRLVTITESDIERELENVRARYATYPEIEDRASENGDLLLVDLTASVEGTEIPDLTEPKETMIEIGKNIPDLDKGLIGLSKGDSKTISATYPENFENADMQGKKATFSVTVKAIRQRALPELDDALAKRARPGISTVDELKAFLKESLEKNATELAENELEFNLVSRIVETSQIHFPDVLLRAEVEAEVRQLLQSLEERKVSVEDYLASIGKTAEQLQGEMALGAGQRIRNSLVLSEVARAEQITVEEADVDAKIAERASQANVSAAAMRAFAEKNETLDRFRDQALTEKILSFLKGSSQITERTLTSAELEAEDAAGAPEAAPAPVEEKPKKRATKKAAAAPEAAPEPAAEPEPAAAPVATAVPKRRSKKAESES